MRRGVAGLFVATEALRGWRELCVEDDHRAATWVRFVARLMDTTCRDAKKVRGVVDNPGTHKASFFYDHFPPRRGPGVPAADGNRLPPRPRLVAQHGGT